MSKSPLNAVLLAAAAVALFVAPSQSFAYGWDNHYGYYGIGGLYRSLDYPTERRVPYFAAHPPVYYSVPVPRTYGYSPFAYGPSVRTPELAACEPVEIINPHVEGASDVTKKEAKTTRDRTISDSVLEVTAPGPLTIDNPFVTGEKSEAVYH